MVDYYPGGYGRLCKSFPLSFPLALLKPSGRYLVLLALIWGNYSKTFAQCEVGVSVPPITCLGQPVSISFDASTSISPVYPILVDYTIGGVAQPQLTMNGATVSVNFTPTVLGSLDIQLVTATDASPVSCSLGAIATTVVSTPTLTFAALADVCISAGVQNGLGGATPTGGVYSGTGVTDDANGSSFTFDPNAVGLASTIITYTYADVNNCTNTTTSTINVIPAPTLAHTITDESCPGADDGTIVFSASAANGPYTLSISNDGGITFNILGSGLSGGTTVSATSLTPGTYVLKAIDANSCETVETVSIAAGIDNTPPNAVCQNFTLYLNASGTGSITATQVNNGSNDACGIDTAFLDIYDFDCADLGPNTVTLTVRDVNNNSSTCTAIVTVVDTVSPVITCPANLIVNNDPFLCGAQVNLLATASDNCSVLISNDVNAGGGDASDFYPIGTTVVTFTALDPSGNASTCSVSVTVNDAENPTAVCPVSPISFSLPATGVTNISLSPAWANSFDNCSITQTNFYLNGNLKTLYDCSDIGTHNIVVEVVDIAGNTNTCNATIVITDNLAPVVSCKDITVQLDANGQASITPAMLDNGSFDICGIDSLYLSQYDFTCGDVGVNPVILSVRDSSGNIATCTANVTVEDTISPVVICQDIRLRLGSFGFSAINPAMIDNGSSDACGIANMSLSKTLFGCADIGPNTVTLSVTDNNGNISSCTAVVTVVDSLAPFATCKNITVQLDATGNASIVSADVNGTSTFDACGIDTMYLDRYDFTCADIGANTVTLTVVDLYNNSASCTAIVTVLDTEDPVISCPANVVQNVDPGQCGATVFYPGVGVSDNCSPVQVTLISGIGNGNFFPVGTTTETYIATDYSGNTDTCSFTVTISDNEAPVMTCPANFAVSNGLGQCGAIVTYSLPTISDNCPSTGPPVLTTGFASGSLFPLGTTAVGYTYTDQGGNTVSCSFNITVVDTEAPQINCPADITVTGSPSTCDAVVTYSGVTASDNCPGTVSISLIGGLSSGSIFPVGTTVVSYQAVDLAGNVNTCSFNVHVLPAIAPTQANIQMPNLVEVCAEDILTLSANAPGVGETATWTFGDPNAIFVSGPSDPAADLTNLLVPTVSGLNPHPLIWTISNSCFSTSDTIYVQVNALPTGFIFEANSISVNGASDGELLAVPQGGSPPYVAYQWNDPFLQTSQLAIGLASGTYKVVITDDKGCISDSIGYFLDQPPVVPILVDISVYLQGAYVPSASMMHDSLRVRHAADMLNEPYTALGYAPVSGFSANTTLPAVLATTGPTAPVDWVFVELRDKVNPATILGRQAALVLRNGKVVDAGDGVSPLGFDLPSDDYYIAVRHRNHLGVMTVSALTITTLSATSVDFTSSATPTYGSFAQYISAGVQMLWGGDANEDKSIFYTGPSSDAAPIFSKILFNPGNTFFSVSYTVSEYTSEDLNLDGRVIYTGPLTEVNLLFQNILLHPLNTSFSASYTFSEQLP